MEYLIFFTILIGVIFGVIMCMEPRTFRLRSQNQVVFYAERSAPGICRLSEAFMEAVYRCAGRDGAAFFGVNAGAVRTKLIGIDSKGILCYGMNQMIYIVQFILERGRSHAVYVYGTSTFDVSPDLFWYRGDSEPEIGNRGTV